MKGSQKINSMEEAKYGDLILFRPIDSVFSRLIPVIDGSPISHVGMFLKREHGHDLFLESTDGKGVCISRLESWRNYEIWRIPFAPLSPSEVLRDLGKPYDGKKIFELLRFRLFGGTLLADDDSALICSEALNRWYDYKPWPKGETTPATIFNSLHD